MTGDTNNPGWYYKDMDFNAKGYRLDKGDGQETTPIKPGETLMIFYSFLNFNDGLLAEYVAKKGVKFWINF
jgi:hypothetical protein